MIPKFLSPITGTQADRTFLFEQREVDSRDADSLIAASRLGAIRFQRIVDAGREVSNRSENRTMTAFRDPYGSCGGDRGAAREEGWVVKEKEILPDD